VLNVILAALLVMDVSGSSGIMCATPPMQVVAAVRCACGLLARKALPMRCCRSPSFSHTPPLTYPPPSHTRSARLARPRQAAPSARASARRQSAHNARRRRRRK
jgi:hypothetical protein